ncbi:type II toxin-antitoxin system VapC family toxin [Okeanomitos corallinicola TIOX110]|uniref:Ribonuclease VapC n=1 Tax=Okeanomitos corallinicola TIOX110 TaxID=3133117 RepID=A0ABZ2UNS4_9CYAN
MNGRYLLDTNIIIAIFAGEENVKKHLAEVESVFIPSIALGELFYGARKSGRSQQNIEKIEEFISKNIILNCDLETSKIYGEIKNKLRLKGRPLPENDIWIAAISIQHHLTIVTRDAHFHEVENLSIVSW